MGIRLNYTVRVKREDGTEGEYVDADGSLGALVEFVQKKQAVQVAIAFGQPCFLFTNHGLRPARQEIYNS